MSLGLLLPILVGISLGLFGGGGSILSVAILSFALGMPPKAAIAASLLVTAVSSSAAWLAQRGSRLGSVRTGIAFGGAGMVGAFAGGRLASLVTLGSVVGSVVAKRAPPVALRRGFAALVYW